VIDSEHYCGIAVIWSWRTAQSSRQRDICAGYHNHIAPGSNSNVSWSNSQTARYSTSPSTRGHPAIIEHDWLWCLIWVWNRSALVWPDCVERNRGRSTESAPAPGSRSSAGFPGIRARNSAYGRCDGASAGAGRTGPYGPTTCAYTLSAPGSEL